MKKKELIIDLEAGKKNKPVKIQEVINENEVGLVTESFTYEIDSIEEDKNFIYLNFKNDSPDKLVLSPEDADLLSNCTLLMLVEMNRTEKDHFPHLKDSFFQEKKRLLALHSRVCGMMKD